MAYDKIIPVRRRLDHCVNYVLNPEKTDLGAVLEYIGNPDKTITPDGRAVLETAINCQLETAYQEMQETKKRWSKKGGVLGYHLVHSYAPGEVTPEQAHSIGVEFAGKLLQGRYEAIISTHLDHDHIHNHILFNSVSCVDGKKYRDNFKAYPIISSKVNAKYASEIQTTYEEVLQEADNSDLIEAKEKAIAYNNSITPGASVEDAYSQEALLTATRDYEGLLNIADDGIMGYVKIPKIGVQLPIYHGTDNDSLERGIGHLLGSSLPVGGDSTHTILTAHSGMASQKMFSDLPQLEIGDVFYLRILGETLAYQVDKINTVLPHDTTFLGIEQGEDLATLVTCTPFGVNTHRLLVRGERIPYEEAEIIVETTQEEVTESTWEQHYLKGVIIGLICVLIIVVIAVVIWLIWRQCHEKR